MTNMAATLAGLQPSAATPNQATGGFSQGTTQGHAPAALRQSSKKRKSTALTDAPVQPAEASHATDAMQEGPGARGNPKGQQQDAPQASEASAGSDQRKANELQQVYISESHLPFLLLSASVQTAPQGVCAQAKR